jgi:hypothetical protein
MTHWMFGLLACTDDSPDRPDPDREPTDSATTPDPTTTPTSTTTPTTSTVPTEERFLPETVPTDILFVVDNSGSMADDQNRAAVQLAGVVTDLVSAGVDFHLGVTTTDLDGTYAGANGSLVPIEGTTFLSATSPSPEATFAALMSLGIMGSSTEQGTGAVWRALHGSADADFRRDDAAVHVVVVSDEPDLTRATVVGATEFDAWFDALADDPAQRTFSAFADPRFGARYGDLATRFGGVRQDANASDWSSAATGLSERFVQLGRTFVLAGDPDPGTLAVALVRDGDEVTLLAEEWEYDENARTVTVLVDLAAGDEVVVSYLPAS